MITKKSVLIVSLVMVSGCSLWSEDGHGVAPGPMAAPSDAIPAGNSDADVRAVVTAVRRSQKQALGSHDAKLLEAAHQAVVALRSKEQGYAAEQQKAGRSPDEIESRLSDMGVTDAKSVDRAIVLE